MRPVEMSYSTSGFTGNYERALMRAPLVRNLLTPTDRHEAFGGAPLFYLVQASKPLPPENLDRSI